MQQSQNLMEWKEKREWPWRRKRLKRMPLSRKTRSSRKSWVKKMVKRWRNWKQREEKSLKNSKMSKKIKPSKGRLKPDIIVTKISSSIIHLKRRRKSQSRIPKEAWSTTQAWIRLRESSPKKLKDNREEEVKRLKTVGLKSTKLKSYVFRELSSNKLDLMRCPHQKISLTFSTLMK